LDDFVSIRLILVGLTYVVIIGRGCVLGRIGGVLDGLDGGELLLLLNDLFVLGKELETAGLVLLLVEVDLSLVERRTILIDRVDMFEIV
jgi:hypothetical protein